MLKKKYSNFFKEYILPHTFLPFFFLFLAPLYIFHLDSLSISMHGDEANIALQALQIGQHHMGVVGVGWSDLPLLSFLPHALTMDIWGPTLFGQRMGSVIFGFASLVVFYFLVKLLFTQRVALLATLFLGVSHMWLAYSRIGMTNAQAAFIMLSCLYFTIYGIEKKKIWSVIVGGIFLGLCFYAYFADRITFIVILLYFFLSFFKIKDWKRILSYFLIFTITTIIIAFPQVQFYLQNPGSFSARTSEVFIFSTSQQGWRASQYQSNIIAMLKDQFLQSINIFADNGGQYAYKGQLFDDATIVFFFLGIIYTFFLSKKKWILLGTWFVLVFLGTFLTTSPITLSRVVIGMPVIYLFAALGLDLLISRFHQWKRYLFWGVFACIAYIVYFNLNIYFVKYPQQQLIGVAGDPNALNATHIAYYLNTLPSGYEAIFLTAPHLYVDFATLQFLAPTSIRYGIANPQNFILPPTCPSKTAYIIYPDYKGTFDALVKLCKESTAFAYKDPNGTAQYYVVQTPEY